MEHVTIPIDFTVGLQKFQLMLNERAFPSAETAWDRDFIRASVNVDTGTFSGSYVLLLGAHELVNLHILLQKLWQEFGRASHASFRLREETLHIVFDITKLGIIRLTVRAQPDITIETFLQFVFEAEYNSIKVWIATLEKALRQFPPSITIRPSNPLQVG
ncbi:MAG: hypothetical protein H0X37_04450 [Herpetosiphonaceae bacterium]|nr:hypothetical protein [Herpetosiphonaceae bacterium]